MPRSGEAHEENGYPIELACELLHVARSAYHFSHSFPAGRKPQGAKKERIAPLPLKKA